jgi:hypothetical protein
MSTVERFLSLIRFENGEMLKELGLILGPLEIGFPLIHCGSPA